MVCVFDRRMHAERWGERGFGCASYRFPLQFIDIQLRPILIFCSHFACLLSTRQCAFFNVCCQWKMEWIERFHASITGIMLSLSQRCWLPWIGFCLLLFAKLIAMCMHIALRSRIPRFVCLPLLSAQSFAFSRKRITPKSATAPGTWFQIFGAK